MSIQNISNSSLEIQSGLLIDRGIETRQLCSRQDHVAHGHSPDKQTYWLAAFDGHGKDQAIKQIRNMDLQEMMMEKPTPWKDIQDIIQADSADSHTKTHSGATMVYARVHIYPTYIEVVMTNLGDSTGVVFLNDEPVFVTTPQNYDNGAEMIRLIKEGRVNVETPLLKKSQNFDVISPTTLRSIEGTYIAFESSRGSQELSMTQSLGHNGITGFKPDTTVLRFNRTDKVKVVLCSDGVSDVMPVSGLVASTTFPFMTSTSELLNEAERRWKQKWNVHSGTDFRKIFQTSFPKTGYDDCCCAMLSIEPSLEMPLPPLAMAVDDSAEPKDVVEDEEDDLYS